MRLYIDSEDVLYSKLPMYVAALEALAKDKPDIHKVVDLDRFKNVDSEYVVDFAIHRKDKNPLREIKKRKYKEYDLSEILEKVSMLNHTYFSNISKSIHLYYKRFNNIDIGIENNHDRDLCNMLKKSSSNSKIDLIDRDKLTEKDYDMYILSDTESVIKLIEAGKNLEGKNISIIGTGFNTHIGKHGRLSLNDEILLKSHMYKFDLSIIEPFSDIDVAKG